MKSLIIIFFLFFCIFCTFYQCERIFKATKIKYNGSIGYDGLFKACNKEYPESIPCTVINLMDGFWKQNITASWIYDINLIATCLGYTTDYVGVMGKLLQAFY